ncbi:MAG: DUF1289 domain-containing protein [Gammaproteobacteria bacterium]|nr:DUF1289 domain-containing protein [Gammaproteobacteria bacterium]MBQ0840084.1 DUF1289 domain-containing protein [Gammaproteobacteria bacterium]
MAGGAVAEAPVVSPCVSICVLGAGDICTGCHRSGGEIRQWVSLDNAARRAVLKNAQARGKVGNPFA